MHGTDGTLPRQLDTGVTYRQACAMAREVELRKSAAPVPVQPDSADVPAWYQPVEHVEHVPDWMELRPPYRPDSELEHGWSVALTPFRAVALVFLWITYRWYRCALLVLAIILFNIALHA